MKKTKKTKKPPPNQKQPSQSRLKSLWQNLLKFPQLLCKSLKLAWKMIGFVAVVIGLLASFYTFYPHLNVEPGLILDPYNPFENPFKIHNSGLIDLKNLYYTITPLYIKPEYMPAIIGKKETRILRTHDDKIKIIESLKSGEKTNVYINEIIKLSPPLTDADIIMNINFTIFFIPKEKRFRFKITKNINSETHWEEKSISEEISY
ncbi:MAG: hypothetical protein HUU32_04530 [Calditrichaceae bacterium]|nr:hypothetical protein [Calditrichia bacterium]NUQ40641.1 hypothetical protein [Calditrichaceae bacterium]